MITAQKLDDPGFLQESDPEGMLVAVETFHRQCEDALKQGEGFSRLPTAEKVKGLCFIGMGGSGIGGDILSSLLVQESGLPVLVHKDYGLPGSVGSEALVVATSYSGNTEETLSGFEEAMARGCPILAVTSGGELGQRASRLGVPCIIVPQGMQPRAALGYLTLPAGMVLERMGLLEGFSSSSRKAMESMRRQGEGWRPDVRVEDNSAKRMAGFVDGRIPLVYGAHGPLQVAAYRWKCQFNENAKNPAYYNVLPEMNHNEMAGWEIADELKTSLVVIILADAHADARMAKKVKVTAQLLREQVAGVEVVEVEGSDPLEKLMTAVHMGDYVSVYLALLKGVDPTPVDAIARLKKKMAGGD